MLLAVAVGGYLYTRQVRSVTAVGGNPETTVNITAVRNDLLALANAERRYWASNAKYASLDELQTNGDIHIPTRPTYSYSALVSENTFKIVATYSGSDPKAPKQISVDETMAITNE